MPRSSCQWTLVQFTAATQTGCGGSGPKHKKAVKFKRHEGKRWEKSRINIKTMRPLNWIGYPWPMFEAHIFLQNTAAQHSSEYLLADNNNTSALHHRWTQSLIPCRCNLVLFIFYFSPLLVRLLTNPLLPITLKIICLKGEGGGEYKNPKQCTLPRGCCNADYSVCEPIRSVSEYEVSRWIYSESGFQTTSGGVWLKGLWGWVLFPLTELIGKSQIRMPDLTMINGLALLLLSCKWGDPV